MISVALALAMSLTTDSGTDGGSSTEELVVVICDHGYERVGVLPRFMARKPGEAEALAGAIGPQAEAYAEDLEVDLARRSKGRFQVVPGPQIRRAMAGLTLPDLDKPETLRAMAAKVNGLDALIIGSVVDGRDLRGERDAGSGLNVRCRVVGIADGTLAGTARERVSPTLGDGAYMGESWELRRWTRAGLINVGLREEAQGSEGGVVSPFGAGPGYSAAQYPLIRRDRRHPLDDPECPFRLAVKVDGQGRHLTKVGNDSYVALEPGEAYAVEVQNRTDRRVYMAQFIDGINVLGKRRENPNACLYWDLKPGGVFLIGGWVTQDGVKDLQEDFEILPADDTVAVGQGFGEQLGLITTVFYTVGMAGVPEAPKLKAMMADGTFGTGARQAHEISLTRNVGDRPGLILAALTIHYRTSSQLRQLQERTADR
jgi:hypothetical protein